MPGRTRPARPRRCFAAAWETITSSSELIRRSASYRSSFTRPVSMTHVTSSIVMDVSATFVDRTTLHTPGGGRKKTLRWSSGGRLPCRGRIQSGSRTNRPRRASAPPPPPCRRLASIPSASFTASISLVPGKNTRIAAPSIPRSLSAIPLSHRSSRALGSLANAWSTSPSASTTNHLTSSEMSCTFTTFSSSCASARHAARARC
mmetsp:Transcript_15606/g.56059  ORF Transcript_15606/g.56059 Transcript_15606/m.56059 type:complete len:204 (+) Transcript_15606:742-1353(+)